MATRGPEREAFVGAGALGEGAYADLSGLEGAGSSSGATSINSMGEPFCGPCSRHLKSNCRWRICSNVSARLESVSQLVASQRGQTRRAAKVRVEEILGMAAPGERFLRRLGGGSRSEWLTSF